MAFLYAAYFDASAKGRMICVAGGVAPVKKWTRFETEWQKVMQKYGVNELHYTYFASRKGEYEGWSDEKRHGFIEDLSAVIRPNVNKKFSICCELDAWDAVNKDYLLEERCHSPYALCGFAVVKGVLKWAAGKNISPRNLKIIFEKGDPGWGGLDKLCAGIGVSPVPLPKDEAIPCQVGDWVGWKTRIGFSDGAKHYEEFKSSKQTFEQVKVIMKDESSMMNAFNAPGEPGVFSESSLRKTCRDSGIPRRPLGGENEEIKS